MATTQVKATSLSDLRTIIQTLLPNLKAGMVIGLVGSLGAGKTAFVKLLAEALGVREDVISPTYVYHQSYPALVSNSQFTQIHHLDLYRIHSEKELSALDLIVTDPDGLVLIEWIDRVPELLDRADLIIKISVSQGIRTLSFDWKQQ